MRLEKFIFKEVKDHETKELGQNHPMYTYAKGLLSLATGNCVSFAKFSKRHPGFNSDFFSPHYVITAEITLSDDEKQIARELWKKVKDSGRFGDELQLEGEIRITKRNGISSPNGLKARLWTRMLWKHGVLSFQDVMDVYNVVGDVIFFDEYFGFANWHKVYPKLLVDTIPRLKYESDFELGVQYARNILTMWLIRHDDVYQSLQDDLELFGIQLLGPKMMKDEMHSYFLVRVNNVELDIGSLPVEYSLPLLMLIQKYKSRIHKDCIIVTKQSLTLNL